MAEKKRLLYTSISLPKLKYRPTKASFVREAVLEKYKKELEAREYR